MEHGLKVGELARRAGVSVRTLHFYEQIGLLTPADRTGPGYRLYDSAQILRLQQITSLRQLGMSLERIRAFLDADEEPPARVLRMHISELDGRIDRMRWLQDRLRSLARRLDGPGDVATEDVLKVIRDMNATSKHFTPEQLEQLKQRADALGPERIQQAQDEWRELLGRFEAAMKRNDNVSCPAVQALARKAQELIKAFSGGDAAIERSVAARYRDEGASNIMAQHGWNIDQSVFTYMQEAMASLHTGERAEHRNAQS